MGETIEKTMNLVQARAMLGNTRALSSEQIEAAQRILNSFYASKPRKACAACGCMIWSEHNGGVWACDRCHRGPELTQAQFNAAEAARREAADAHLRATEAAAPKPRDVLRERLAALAAARAELAKIEAALPAARAAVTEAESRKFAAEAAAETSNADAAEVIAASFLTGAKPTRPAPSAAAARAELAAAVDTLVIARNAMVIIRGKIETAEAAVGYATDKCRKAAYGVLVAERLENLLADVAQARAAYLESAGQLGWLIKTHVVPGDDRRAHQFLGEANQPPSTWREAATAGTAHMEDALAALLANPTAAVT